MNHHPRRPAAIILLASMLLGIGFVVTWGRVLAYRQQQHGGGTVDGLRQRIAAATQPGAGPVSAATWRAYGEAMMSERNFDEAAKAYEKALALEPNHRDWRFQRGLALAQIPNAGELFYRFQKELVYSDAKLADDLFSRAEAQKFLTDEKFSALAKEARNQAMD